MKATAQAVGAQAATGASGPQGWTLTPYGMAADVSGFSIAGRA